MRELGSRFARRKKLRTSATATPYTPPPPATTLAAVMDGSNGNHVCWPQSFVCRGSTRRMDGAVLANGNQVVYETDFTNGRLLSMRTIRAVNNQDDHNVPSGSEYSDGGQLWVGAGHGGDPGVEVQYRDPDGTWTVRTPVTFSGNVTYPGLFIDANGRAWLHVRAGSLKWVLCYSDDRGATWSPEVAYMTGSGSTLIYGYLRFGPTKAYGWGRYNSAAANFGIPKPFELDLLTGEFTSGSVGLGKLDGTASANGNVLPFSLDTIPSLVTPPTGYAWDVLEHTEDGKKAVLILINTSDIADSQIEHWQVANAADRYDDAKYSKKVLTNFGARLGYNGFDGYPNLCYDRATGIAGTRLYINRKINVAKAEPVAPTGTEPRWVLEQWDDTTGANTNWTSTRLLSGTEAYDSMCRPLGAYGANELTPISLSRIRVITDYNKITDARLEFFDPKKGRQGFIEEAATARWAFEAGFEPTTLQRAIVNSGFRDMQVGGLLTSDETAVGWMKAMLAGEYPVSPNSAVNAVLAGMAADYVAETGQALPVVLRPLTLTLSALPRVGTEITATLGFTRPSSTITVTTPSGQTIDASNGTFAWTPNTFGKQLVLSVTETKTGFASRTTQFPIEVQSDNQPYFRDTLTNTNGTSIYSHVPETGQMYTRRSHTNAGSVTISNGGVVFSSSSGMQLQVGAAPVADVHFEADIVARNTTSSSTTLLVRCPDDNGNADLVDDDGYCVYWSNTNLQHILAVRTDGVVTALIDEAGNPCAVADTWPSGVTKKVAITAHGNRISMSINGSLKCTAIDSTYSGPGRLGIRNSAAGSGSNFGRVILELRAWDVSAGS